MATSATTGLELNQKLLEELLKIQIDAETKMLQKVANRVKRGITTTGWNEQKLQDVQLLRKEIEAILSNTDKLSKIYINKSLIKAYNSAGQNVSKALSRPTTAMNDLVPLHLQRMILETHKAISGTSFQILRNIDDVYREVISETTTGVLIGTDTRMQVAQQALNNFAARGVTGFTDKAGRKWELASYVEMVIRTANSRAALQGHVDKSLELGQDLMLVSGHAATCPICAPWGNKVLSISGKTPNYPTLASAREAGLFHPNCKHTLSVWFEGISKEFDDENISSLELNTQEADIEKYKAIQKQRYNERMIRKYKRLEAVALNPELATKAHNKVLEWQKIQREHVSQWELRRKYIREGIKNRTGSATKASKLPDLPKDILPKAKPKDLPETKPVLLKDIKKPAKEKPVDKPKKPEGFVKFDKGKMFSAKEYKDTKDKAKIIRELGYDMYVSDFNKTIYDYYVYELKRKEIPDYNTLLENYATLPDKIRAVLPSIDVADSRYEIGSDKWRRQAVMDLKSLYVNAEGPNKAVNQKYWEEFYEDKLKDAPVDKIRYIMSDSGKRLKKVSFVDSGGSYYSSYENAIYINKSSNRLKGAFTVDLHEYGHALDSNSSFRKNTFAIVSRDLDYYEAIKSDCFKLIDNWKETEKELSKKGVIDRTNGIQDTLEGIGYIEKGKRYRVKWGHDKDYWLRKGVDAWEEVASESFAHMTAAMFDETQEEYMQQYMPNAYKKFKELINVK